MNVTKRVTAIYYMIESCGNIEEGLYFDSIDEAKEEIFDRLNAYGYAEGMTTKDYNIIEEIRIINRFSL